jgi:hypothetical protein
MSGAATLTRDRMEGMTTTTMSPATEALNDVEAAYRKRRDMARRLADQDKYIGEAVRTARARGVSWADMARAGQVSDVAILKAARRPDENGVTKFKATRRPPKEAVPAEEDTS